MLTDRQNPSVEGVCIGFSCNELTENYKGDLLTELLECVGNTPSSKKIMSTIIKGAAPLIKKHLVPVIKEWISKELHEVITGKEGS